MDGREELWTNLSGNFTGALHWSDSQHQLVVWNSDVLPQNAADPADQLWCLVYGCTHIYFADMDGDGLPDLINGGYGDLLLAFGASAEGPFNIRYNLHGMSNRPAGFSSPVYTTLSPRCRLRITDIDGDGRSEFVAAQPDPTSDFDCLNTKSVVTDSGRMPVQADAQQISVRNTWGDVLIEKDVKGYDLFAGDFNGDGLQDYLVLPNSLAVGTGGRTDPGRVIFNTGKGLSAGFLPVNIARESAIDVRIADLNGDGRDDIVSITKAGINAVLSFGNGGFGSAFTLAANPGYEHPVMGHTLTQFGDFNGDGRLDVVKVNNNLQIEVLEQNATYPARITAAYDEPTVWPREVVTYSNEWSNRPAEKAPTCAYPISCKHLPMTVVRQVDERAAQAEVGPANPLSSAQKLLYSYEDPAWDLQGRGALGFAAVRVFDPATRAETTTTYDNRTVRQGQGSRHRYPFVGRATSVTTVIPIFKPNQIVPPKLTARVSRTITDEFDEKSLNGGVSYAVFPKHSYTVEWEESVTVDSSLANSTNTTRGRVFGIDGPSGQTRRVDANYEFDAYGNAMSVSRKTQGGVSRTVVTHVENRLTDQNGATVWLLGLPLDRTETRSEADGDPPAVSRRVDFHHNALGQLDRIDIEKNGTRAVRATTQYEFDANGLPTKITDSAPGVTPRVRHVEYAPYCPTSNSCAPDEKLYPSQTWMEYEIAAYRPSSWIAMHPAYGVVVATMDVIGAQTVGKYDEFGRPIYSKRDGEDAMSVMYDARPDSGGGFNGLLTTTTVGNRVSQAHTDALSHVILTTTKGFNGNTLRRKATYDLRGRLSAASQSYTGSTPTAWTSFKYDSLNRRLNATLPDGSLAQAKDTSFGMFQTHMWDAQGNEAYLDYDVDGRIVKSTNKLNASTSIVTNYSYAPFDMLDRVTDAKGNITRQIYDVRGRRTQLEDPDRGTLTTTYNGLGDRVESKRLATNDVQTVHRDSLGRPQEVVSTIAGALATDASLTWDSCSNGIGKLCYAEDSLSLIYSSFGYDGAGRVIRFNEGAESGGDYTIDVGYDTRGRVDTVAYPQVPGRNRFTLKYAYNNADFLQSISDATPGQTEQSLWTVVTRNPDLALVDAKLGAGSITGPGASAIALHRQYDGLGRLQSHWATNPANPSTNLLTMSYDYWPNGLLKTRTSNDGAYDRNESFGYDSLGRLTSWTPRSRTAGSTTDYSAAIGTSGSYDSIGNLTDVTVPGWSMTHNTYGKSDGSQPHTLILEQDYNWNDFVADWDASGAPRGYVYDPAGRQTSGGWRTQIEYAPFDLPRHLVNAGQSWDFEYDVFGRRYRKIGPSEATTYIAGLYEARVQGGNWTHVFHVRGPDGPVAQVTYAQPASGTASASATTTDFLIADALGSVRMVARSGGTVVLRNYHDPWGKRINGNNAPFPTPLGAHRIGFTGQEHDDALGVINFKGRLYDPSLKRFLTADPMTKQLWSGQSWNPYSYVHNSPLNFTDPSGFGCVQESWTPVEDGGFAMTRVPCAKGAGPTSSLVQLGKSAGANAARALTGNSYGIDHDASVSVPDWDNEGLMTPDMGYEIQTQNVFGTHSDESGIAAASGGDAGAGGAGGAGGTGSVSEPVQPELLGSPNPVIDWNRPFTIEVRNYAPFRSFGGQFRGDNRGPTTDRAVPSRQVG